jgi:hypothetical protein
MKKQLDTDSISNELRGASLFFRHPDRTGSELPPGDRRKDAVGRVDEGTPTASLPQRPVPAAPEVSASAIPETRPAEGSEPRPPVRRRLTRVPFEFYQDQIERLRRRSLRAKLRGEKGSMSEMVRDALDRYLRDLPPEPDEG